MASTLIDGTSLEGYQQTHRSPSEISLSDDLSIESNDILEEIEREIGTDDPTPASTTSSLSKLVTSLSTDMESQSPSQEQTSTYETKSALSVLQQLERIQEEDKKEEMPVDEEDLYAEFEGEEKEEIRALFQPAHPMEKMEKMEKMKDTEQPPKPSPTPSSEISRRENTTVSKGKNKGGDGWFSYKDREKSPRPSYFASPLSKSRGKRRNSNGSAGVQGKRREGPRRSRKIECTLIVIVLYAGVSFYNNVVSFAVRRAHGRADKHIEGDEISSMMPHLTSEEVDRLHQFQEDLSPEQEAMLKELQSKLLGNTEVEEDQGPEITHGVGEHTQKLEPKLLEQLAQLIKIQQEQQLQAGNTAPVEITEVPLQFRIDNNVNFEILLDVKQMMKEKKVGMPFFWNVPPNDAGGLIANRIMDECFDLTRAEVTNPDGAHTFLHKSSKLIPQQLPGEPQAIEIPDDQIVEDVLSFSNLYILPTVFNPAQAHHAKAKMFSFFLHPNHRTAYMFRYMLRWKNDPRYDDRITKMDLLSYGKFLLDKKNEDQRFRVSNWIVRSLVRGRRTSDMGPADVEVATKLIKEKCIIGLYDKMGESMKRLEKAFQWGGTQEQTICAERILEKPVIDETVIKSVGPDEWKVLSELNKWDIMVYDNIRKIFDEQGKDHFRGWA